MSEGLRRLLGWSLTGLLALVVLVGLALGPTRPDDRVEQLASRLRCPTCQGVSVADSPSETARAMRAVIEEQVTEGSTDAEIISYFEDRYGSWVVLAPPARGRTLLLWLAAPVALAAGAFLVIGAVRRRPSIQTPGRARTVAGSGLVVGACLLVGWLAFQALEEEPVAQAGRDLSTVTNEEMEEVIATNPEVVGMRLALADRYFQSGQFSNALTHYREVLDRQPRHPEALARVGWMVFLSGEPEVAARFEERALAEAPDYAEAKWYLANVRLDGLADPEGAIPLLEELLEVEDLPPDVLEAVRQRLEEAQREVRS